VPGMQGLRKDRLRQMLWMLHLCQAANMDWTEARTVYEELSSLSAVKGEPLHGIWRDLLECATRYAELRAQWALTPLGNERGELDRERSLAHDVFIGSCNAMSRTMVSQGLDVTWRKRLGDQDTIGGRKNIGDFACFVHCLLGLAAR
jgi:hypothetical protein